MAGEELISTLSRAVEAVAEALAGVSDWTAPGDRAGQYRIDLVADAAAVAVLAGAGLSVLSEESGVTAGGPLVAVLDPVDGSTNASRGIPWYSTSICVVDGEGPLCALVGSQTGGPTYEAVRGEGALRDGQSIAPGAATDLAESLVAVSGYPGELGWGQFRAFGAASLDLCAVADGRLDGFLAGGGHELGVWDYLGGFLVCEEVGAQVVDAFGRQLVVIEHAARRSPVAASSRSLLDALVERRRAVDR